jgi:transcriptional regulator with XRE-family HTH domain
MLGNNLAEYRKKLKISQRELGRRSGVSGQMISKIENDNTIPSFTTLSKIADALGITLNELLAGESEVIGVETDDVHGILDIINYSGSIKLDDIELTNDEKNLISLTIINILDSIRYNRLRNDKSTDN